MSLIKSIKSLNVKSVNPAPVFLDPSQYRSQMTDMFLAGGQGPLQQFTYQDNNSSLTAYEKCPPLTAVINKKAQAYINGKTWVMDKKGKESVSEFANKLRARLAKPNPLQSWKQFEAQNYIYQQIFGYCIVLPIIPAGFKKNIDATSLWNIPGNMIKPFETNKLWYQTELKGILQKIVLTYKGHETELPLDLIYIFKDFAPSFKTMIFPESRVCSLEMPINNIIGALASRNVLINYRGALGILSSDSDKFGYVPIKEGDKESLQNDFRRYGLIGQQWKFIITSAAVKWQQMGIPTRDLMLFEEIEDDVNMICDSYSYPIDLMAGSTRKTYQNSDAAGKGLYQNAIIPEADSMYDQWNIFFDCAANNVELEKDYSHIPILQQNKGEQATARNTLGQALEREFKNNWITYNRVLELLGEDTITGMDKYYKELLEMGYVFGSVNNVISLSPEQLNPPANNQTG